MKTFTICVMLVVLTTVSCQGLLPDKPPPYSVVPCKSECTADIYQLKSKADIEEKARAQEALKANPDIQKRIEELEAQSQPEAEILPVKRCDCPSQCVPKTEYVYRCGGCSVIWPSRSLRNIGCRNPGSYCPLGCGCAGTCQPSGPRSQLVVLYCPRQRPPFVIKKVTLCTNCCCHRNPWWVKG